MKLLLHTCCAPCAIYPVKLAKSDGYNSIATFFYNPNIHPSAEFAKRKIEIDRLTKSENSDAINTDYRQEDYFKRISDFDDTRNRCPSCWNLRLEKTAELAEKMNFDAFSTTLLGSPYQDHEVIKEICSNLSKRFNIRFYYSDFRTGFRDAHKEAKELGIYCQNYCGCVFSLVERYESKKKKD